MLQFRLFGYPIKIEWFFLLLCLFLGMGYLDSGGPEGFALFFVSSAILFLSILLHELGHAWARKKYGAPYSEIVLHGFGGYCTGPGKFSRNQSIAISASGPAMNLVLAGLCFFLLEAFPTLPPIAKVAAVWGWRLNIALALLNLIPLYPLDGGQILAQLLGPKHFRTVLWISIALAIAIAAFGVLSSAIFLAIIFGMMAWGNWQRLQGQRSQFL